MFLHSLNRFGLAALLAAALMAASCGGSSESEENNNNNNTSGKALGSGPCNEASECKGNVCVALIDGKNPPAYCTQECSGTCPDGFYCDDSTFGLVGLNFCRFAPEDPEEEPAQPTEPPRLPCTSDEDCMDGLVCATYEGERDCTITCAAEDDCTPPAMAGMVVDLSTCAADQTAGQDRTVCLPDAACFPNIQTCIHGSMQTGDEDISISFDDLGFGF